MLLKVLLWWLMSPVQKMGIWCRITSKSDDNVSYKLYLIGETPIVRMKLPIIAQLYTFIYLFVKNIKKNNHRTNQNVLTTQAHRTPACLPWHLSLRLSKDNKRFLTNSSTLSLTAWPKLLLPLKQTKLFFFFLFLAPYSSAALLTMFINA